MVNLPFADHEIEVGAHCWLRVGWHLRSAVGVRKGHFVRPNVRVEAGPTASRRARAGENVPRTTGLGLVACRWASPRTRG
jgi:hypothetical protein